MTQRNLLSSARHIVIEGPIGVGKTSLARRLAEHLEADLLLEQPEANPFLARFYQNQQRYALQTQLCFLFQRLDQMRDLAQPDLFPRTVISDYLMEKELLFAGLTLGDDEYRLYRQIYDRVSPQAGAAPDLVIYLAGADPYQDDRLGRLALTFDGLAERDRVVFRRCQAQRLPVAIAMAGGYARQIADTVQIHHTTIRLAKAMAGG